MGVSSGLEKYAAWFQSEGTLKKSKSRKIEKWKGFIVNFEKSKSQKVEGSHFQFQKVEKSKR